jgi:hypothetical protein
MEMSCAHRPHHCGWSLKIFLSLYSAVIHFPFFFKNLWKITKKVEISFRYFDETKQNNKKKGSPSCFQADDND